MVDEDNLALFRSRTAITKGQKQRKTKNSSRGSLCFSFPLSECLDRRIAGGELSLVLNSARFDWQRAMPAHQSSTPAKRILETVVVTDQRQSHCRAVAPFVSFPPRPHIHDVTRLGDRELYTAHSDQLAHARPWPAEAFPTVGIAMRGHCNLLESLQSTSITKIEEPNPSFSLPFYTYFPCSGLCSAVRNEGARSILLQKRLHYPTQAIPIDAPFQLHFLPFPPS